MTSFYGCFFDRNVLLALGVLPPTLLLFGGHVASGCCSWPASSLVDSPFAHRIESTRHAQLTRLRGEAPVRASASSLARLNCPVNDTRRHPRRLRRTMNG